MWSVQVPKHVVQLLGVCGCLSDVQGKLEEGGAAPGADHCSSADAVVVSCGQLIRGDSPLVSS